MGGRVMWIWKGENRYSRKKTTTTAFKANNLLNGLSNTLTQPKKKIRKLEDESGARAQKEVQTDQDTFFKVCKRLRGMDDRRKSNIYPK